MEEVGGGPVGPFEDLEVIRMEAGMSTSRFCRMIDMPERTWRRWQAYARDGHKVKGPWPAPVRDEVRASVLRHAGQHPTWGHRKIWAMCAYEGHTASPSTVMRVLQDEGMLLAANYTKERRDLAGQRKKAFAAAPSGPNQVWQLDFSEYETVAGGTWQVAGCRDYWSKYEFTYHLSPTANQYDAIAALEAAIAEAEAMLGTTLLELATDPATGEITPILTIVTDNGGPFRSFRFQAFIATHPELRHVRTRVKSPGQNGSRERGFGTLKYEKLYCEQIDDALDLQHHLDAYRLEYNTIRPHEAIAFNRPQEVHLGLADPRIPSFQTKEILPTT